MYIQSRYLYCSYLPFKFYLDKPDAAKNIRVLEKDNVSFIVQWDAVTDLFPITYTIRWYGEGIDNTTTTNEPLYRITGLTSNTSYSVTVVANNTCCGAGDISDAIVVTTSESTNDIIGMYVCSYSWFVPYVDFVRFQHLKE